MDLLPPIKPKISSDYTKEPIQTFYDQEALFGSLSDPQVISRLSTQRVVALGVAPVFYDHLGQILTVEHRPTEKVPQGGWGVPSETSKYVERDGKIIIEPIELTISRLLFEELNIQRPHKLPIYRNLYQPYTFQTWDLQNERDDTIKTATSPFIGLSQKAVRRIFNNFEPNDEVASISLDSQSSIHGRINAGDFREGQAALFQRLGFPRATQLQISKKDRLYFSLPSLDNINHDAKDIKLCRHGLGLIDE